MTNTNTTMAKTNIIKSYKTVGGGACCSYLKECPRFCIIGQIFLSGRFILAITDVHIKVSFQTKDGLYHHTGFVHIVSDTVDKNPKAIDITTIPSNGAISLSNHYGFASNSNTTYWHVMKFGDLLKIAKNNVLAVAYSPWSGGSVRRLQITLYNILKISAEFLLGFNEFPYNCPT